MLFPLQCETILKYLQYMNKSFLFFTSSGSMTCLRWVSLFCNQVTHIPFVWSPCCFLFLSFPALKLILRSHATLTESAHGMLLLKICGNVMIFTRPDRRNEIESLLIRESYSDIVIRMGWNNRSVVDDMVFQLCVLFRFRGKCKISYSHFLLRGFSSMASHDWLFGILFLK